MVRIIRLLRSDFKTPSYKKNHFANLIVVIINRQKGFESSVIVISKIIDYIYNSFRSGITQDRYTRKVLTGNLKGTPFLLPQ
jgi:hypothetical protein